MTCLQHALRHDVNTRIQLPACGMRRIFRCPPQRAGASARRLQHAASARVFSSLLAACAAFFSCLSRGGRELCMVLQHPPPALGSIDIALAAPQLCVASVWHGFVAAFRIGVRSSAWAARRHRRRRRSSLGWGGLGLASAWLRHPRLCLILKAGIGGHP